VKLLLDEMISPRIARELRKGAFDVQAIKSDRSELEALADIEVLRRAAAGRRALVTNDVLDFRLIHNRLLDSGEGHFGIVFTSDATMPRNKASVSLWTKTLRELLKAHPEDDALRNRVLHLL
jgi:predicted nuclease of predicted toxin-antitoxin system